MPRRIIYLKNPSSGSHFRTVNRDGGGGASGSARLPKGGASAQVGFMFYLFNWMATGHKDKYAKRVKKGKGISAAPGVFIGTGGARYKGAPSSWFQKKRDTSADGGYIDLQYLTPGPYDALWSAFPFDDLGSVNHYAMNVQPAFGTPGTGFYDPFANQWNYFNQPYTWTPSTAADLPSGLTGIDPNWNAPSSPLMQAWQKGQEQPLNIDFSKVGILPREWKWSPETVHSQQWEADIAWTFLLGPLHTEGQEEWWTNTLGFTTY